MEDAVTLPKTYAQAFDETGLPGECLPQYRQVRTWLDKMPRDFLMLKRREAEFLFRRIGITFAVYNDGGDPERLIPFDIIPRIIHPDEWKFLSLGLTQRVKALNAFIDDVYHAREIMRAGKVPAELVLLNDGFRAEMQGLDTPRRVYTHVSGIDMVRVGPKDFYVLEDNCRTPSGVSYMLENREAMMRLFPDLCAHHRIAPVSHYPEELLDTLRSVAPPNCPGEPVIALLTPGANNSAYYEHSFLADEMGIELVEGADLVVEDNVVYMRTTEGPKRVDVIYRRIDDGFLRSADFPARFAGRHARPVQRLPRRQRDAGQRGGRRHRRRQGGLSPCAGDDPLLSGRGADPVQRADLFLRRRQGAELCARSSRRTGGEGGARLRRLRHAGRAARHPGGTG